MQKEIVIPSFLMATQHALPKVSALLEPHHQVV